MKEKQNKFLVKTWGCQMNVLDGDKIVSLMESLGYEQTEEMDQANIILLNTCSVREGPQNKVFSELFRLKQLKEKNLQILGVVGCVAQQEKSDIFKKAPFVDLVMGTRSILHLPELIKQAKLGKAIETSFGEDTLLFPSEILKRNNKTKASITVMEGCNKKCSYCVVPETRGREVCKPLNSIIEEVKILVQKGYKEFELLGQNVNCYKWENKTFVDLLDEVSSINGVERLRFITSHPKHFPIEAAKLMAERKNICKYLHIPMQSGSSKILKLMRRQYDQKFYLKLIDEIKSIVPEIALSSDFIVGFPTETEEDFQETLKCVSQLEFDTIYAFKFSPRPKTPAETLTKVPESEAKERLTRLLDLQLEIQKRKFDSLVGKKVEVLLEGESKQGNQYSGRTDCNKVVNFISKKKLEVNNFYQVKITQSLIHSLYGEAQI